MPLKLYNNFSRSYEELLPCGESKNTITDYPPVTIYSCGPTVYSYAHIGNFRTFVFNDLLRRYIKFKGFTVNHAMNITDVDDKTIRGALQSGKSLKDYTEFFTKTFFEDLASLNIEIVEHYPKATESIDAMEDIISRLDEKGYIYEKEGSIYFCINKFLEYGRLTRIDTSGMKTGTRYDTDEYDKDDVRDFVLWKGNKEGEPYWTIKYGNGRPGWHIECSAMVRKIFGSTIDIHTGGVDLMFPHHENEIAQSEAAYDEKFARFWIHCQHLQVEGAKMSKSAGNFWTLRDLIEKGYSARAVRFVLLSAHYGKQLNFTLDGLKSADQPLSRIDNFIVMINSVSAAGNVSETINNFCDELLKNFEEAMDDDLNISKATGFLFDYIHNINNFAVKNSLNKNEASQIINTLTRIDTVLGYIFFQKESISSGDAERIEKLIAERIQAKSEKNFKLADDIRKNLLEEGIILEDTKDGTRWKKN